MIVYRGVEAQIPHAMRAVAVGVFDGVHVAHAHILKKTVDAARKNNLRAAAVTFFPHPQEVLSKHKSRPLYLTTLNERLELFHQAGLDEVWLIRFNPRVANISAEHFLGKLLINKFGAAYLSVGHDFCFGKKAGGNAAFLRSASKKMGFGLSVCPVVRRQGKAVSSSAIRFAIQMGKLRLAAAMLGRPVQISGKVIPGFKRGRSLGFPTANLRPTSEVLPPQGVYAVVGRWGGVQHPGMMHVGARPTYGETTPSVEANFFDWKGSLYGRRISLLVMEKLRSVKRFDTPEELRNMLFRDEQRARKILYKSQFGRYNHKIL